METVDENFDDRLLDGFEFSHRQSAFGELSIGLPRRYCLPDQARYFRPARRG
jgi:hypothetical protein